MKDVNVSIYYGTSKKDGKDIEWTAIKLEIGDWSTLIFPKSKFELEYVKKILGQ